MVKSDGEFAESFQLFENTAKKRHLCQLCKTFVLENKGLRQVVGVLKFQYPFTSSTSFSK